MPTIEYNPIIPKNFAPLLKSKQENGTHRFVAVGGRYIVFINTLTKQYNPCEPNFGSQYLFVWNLSINQLIAEFLGFINQFIKRLGKAVKIL